jgi:hypothetical protein
MPSGSCPTRMRPLSRRRRKVIHNLRKANYPCGRQGRLVCVRLGRAADTAGLEQVEDVSGADRARADPQWGGTPETLGTSGETSQARPGDQQTRRDPADICAPGASASTSSGCAYFRPIRRQVGARDGGDAVVRGETCDQTDQESRSAGHRADASLIAMDEATCLLRPKSGRW